MNRFSFRCAIVLMVLVAVMAGPAAADPGWFWQNPLPQGNPLWSVAMLDAETVIAVGVAGTILKSADGGATWTPQSSRLSDGTSKRWTPLEGLARMADHSADQNSSAAPHRKNEETAS